MIMRKWAVRAVPAFALPLVAIAAGEAQAGGFGIREQSAYYQGTAFAGSAAGGEGLASMFWNPAAISFAPGLNVEGNVTYIAPHASVDVFSATAPVTGADLGTLGVGDIVDNGVVPATYITYAWDKIALGVAVTAPFGLITDASCNWAGRYYGCYSRIFDMNFQGSLAYKVNDWLTLGGGLNINYIDARLSNGQVLGVIPAMPPVVVSGWGQVDGDDIGWGFNLGALFTLAPGTTLGVGYKSSIEHNLSGTLSLGLPKTQIAKLGAEAGLTLPDQITASFRSQIDPKWTVLGTVEWTNWSTVQQLVVKSNGATASVLDLQWNDGWYFSAGVEYRWDPKLALRAGIAYELSPVPDETRSPRLPDTNRTWLSAGLTYDFTPQIAMDFAYSHIFGETSPINLYPTDPANALRGSLVGEVSDGYVDIISVALRYKFNAPTSSALITK
ncbi:OmpP1/FadL family transporter [Xanthobacter sp. AM11]|uniref:OmpP1/FadL family transporter n=1 Tax=Xanthobacter sp. AM11 TaxID=3380643 RepID=UPI0039BF44D1